jgi:hypothetical protein
VAYDDKQKEVQQAKDMTYKARKLQIEEFCT